MSNDNDNNGGKKTAGMMGAAATIGATVGGPAGAFVGGAIGGLAGLAIEDDDK